MRYGALEAGGTKMVLSLVDDAGTMLERVSLPTGTPEDTMPGMLDFLRGKGIASLGIGCFGPLDLKRGAITSTPKLAWRDYPLAEVFRRELAVPVKLDTDVNAAALAEQRMGAAKGLDSCLYVTVGTGIGGGLVLGERPVHGLVHPELGHQLMRQLPGDPSPEGFCPYHQGCLEGLASGPSMEKRWGRPARELPPDHPAWELEAGYLAQMCMNAIVMFSPERIILGGGVMQQEHLLPRIREKTAALLGGYVRHPLVDEGMGAYIVAPGLGVNSGVMGAYLLAKEALTGCE